MSGSTSGSSARTKAWLEAWLHRDSSTCSRGERLHLMDSLQPWDSSTRAASSCRLSTATCRGVRPILSLALGSGGRGREGS